MSDVRMKYTGATPGADSNDYVLFSSVGLPSCAACGVPRYSVSIEHAQDGTIKAYKSADGGTTWVQVDQATATASATEATEYTLLVGMYRDFKVVWTNGGSEQTTWVVDQALGKWAAAAVPTAPTVTITAPAESASVDWGETTTYSCTVVEGSGTVTGVSVQIGSATPFNLSDAGGGTWSATHAQTLDEVGATKGVTFTATASDGLTGTAMVTIAVVDPFVALSGTHWRLDQNTTIQSATHSTDLTTWTGTGIASVTDQGGGYYRVTEDTSAGGHDVRATVTNSAAGPASVGYRIKKASTVSHVRIGTFDSASYIRISDGAVTSPAGAHTMSVTDGGTYWEVVHRPTSFSSGTPLLIPQLADGGVVTYTGTGKWAEWAMVGADGLAAGTIQTRVSDVNERVGTYGNFLQATADSQPLLWNSATNTWSQTAGLLFNGSEHMTAGSGTAAQPDTVVLVWQVAVVATAYGVYSGGTSTAGNMTTSTGTIRLNSGAQKDTSQAPETSPMISVTRYNGATSWHRKNGTQTAGLTIGTTSRSGGLMIGQINGGTPTLTGRILDVAYFAGGLDATGAARIEKALAQLRSITLA